MYTNLNTTRARENSNYGIPSVAFMLNPVVMLRCEELFFALVNNQDSEEQRVKNAKNVDIQTILIQQHLTSVRRGKIISFAGVFSTFQQHDDKNPKPSSGCYCCTLNPSPPWWWKFLIKFNLSEINILQNYFLSERTRRAERN